MIGRVRAWCAGLRSPWNVPPALWVLLAGCQGAPAEPAPAEPVGKPAPASEAPNRPQANAKSGAASADGSRSFGRALVDGTPEVPLAQLVGAPAEYAGKSIRTRGLIARVCQAKGCWVELRTDAGDTRLRAPMAGHAFFLPQDVVGERAVIEGEVKAQPLSDAQKAHYRAEGMQAVDMAVSLDAEAVVVAGR